MCFKFSWCLCLSWCLNHALCLAGQQDTTEVLLSVTRNLFFFPDLFFQSLKIPKQTFAMPNSCYVSPAFSCTGFPLDWTQKEETIPKTKQYSGFHIFILIKRLRLWKLAFQTRRKVIYIYWESLSMEHHLLPVIIVTASLKEDHCIFGL